MQQRPRRLLSRPRPLPAPLERGPHGEAARPEPLRGVSGLRRPRLPVRRALADVRDLRRRERRRRPREGRLPLRLLGPRRARLPRLSGGDQRHGHDDVAVGRHDDGRRAAPAAAGADVPRRRDDLPPAGSRARRLQPERGARASRRRRRARATLRPEPHGEGRCGRGGVHVASLRARAVRRRRHAPADDVRAPRRARERHVPLPPLPDGRVDGTEPRSARAAPAREPAGVRLRADVRRGGDVLPRPQGLVLGAPGRRRRRPDELRLRDFLPEPGGVRLPGRVGAGGRRARPVDGELRPARRRLRLDALGIGRPLAVPRARRERPRRNGD